jgi:hypothetical protein
MRSIANLPGRTPLRNVDFYTERCVYHLIDSSGLLIADLDGDPGSVSG